MVIDEVLKANEEFVANYEGSPKETSYSDLHGYTTYLLPS